MPRKRQLESDAVAEAPSNNPSDETQVVADAPQPAPKRFKKAKTAASVGSGDAEGSETSVRRSGRARKTAQPIVAAPAPSKPKKPRAKKDSAAKSQASASKGKKAEEPNAEASTAGDGSDPSNAAAGPGPSTAQTKAPAKASRKKKETVVHAGAGIGAVARPPEIRAGPSEIRAAPLVAEPTQNILDRMHRVRVQTFFMVDRRRQGDELKEEFSVLGSTGNVYKVVIDKKPRCNCPDGYMRGRCKHVLFVFMKVLQVPIESHTWYQTALLTSELEHIFRNAPIAPNAVTNPRVQEAYARATGQLPAAPAESGKKRIPGEEDDCPICYDTMYQVAEAQLTFCNECGNAIHNECFKQWKSTSQRNGKELTCVWCRTKWVEPGASKALPSMKKGRYLNLASAVAGSSYD